MNKNIYGNRKGTNGILSANKRKKLKVRRPVQPCDARYAAQRAAGLMHPTKGCRHYYMGY